MSGDRDPHFVPRWLLRRLTREEAVRPDVAEELRVQRLLYGERRVVSRVERDEPRRPMVR